MVFAHDWSIFYLIKNLRVTEFSILWTLGFTVSRKKEYVQHLFNRLYQALYAKFGNDLKKEDTNQDQCFYLDHERKYCAARLYPDLLEIQIDRSTHYFDIKPESANFLEEFELIVADSNQFINIAVPDQSSYNLAKAINAFLSS
jgi:hypothetical protein